MVKQYPDILTYQKVCSVGGTSYDSEGNVVITDPVSEEISIKCRVEANSKGQYLIIEDGKKVEYGWMIYLPLPSSEIPFGTEVNVDRNGVLVAKGIVKRSVVNQLNAMLWV